jgi:hypothetical protein
MPTMAPTQSQARVIDDDDSTMKPNNRPTALSWMAALMAATMMRRVTPSFMTAPRITATTTNADEATIWIQVTDSIMQPTVALSLGYAWNTPILDIQRCRRGLWFDKMAIVGDKKWEHHLDKLVKPLQVKESKFFETNDDAWSWLTG